MPSKQPVGSSLEVPSTLLTPKNCIAPSRIMAFLRASRSISDDSIRQHLNEQNIHRDCDSYFQSTIAPQWKTRADVIDYCKQYAAVQRHEAGVASEDTQEFNLRLDPYALKNHTEVLERRFNQCDAIDNWVQNETTVENIIREQTSDVLNEKCYYDEWVEKFNKFSART